MMWSLLLGGALAVPQLNQEKSSVKYSLATIKHVWTDASGGVQTATERWNMLILTLDFSEDLYVDYKGVLTRIDELPIAPKIKGWDHFTHIPGFSVPLNRILGGVFEVQASDPEKCGGISPNSRANQWKMFQTGGAFSHPVLTGMPPFEAIGGNPVRTNCGTKEWSPNGCTGKPAPPLPTNEYGADGGCAGRDDFDICPAFATLPYEGETGRGTLMEGLSYVCLAVRHAPSFCARAADHRVYVYVHGLAADGQPHPAHPAHPTLKSPPAYHLRALPTTPYPLLPLAPPCSPLLPRANASLASLRAALPPSWPVCCPRAPTPSSSTWWPAR